MAKRQAKPMQLKSYHFDVGNSSDGPIGFCGRVQAYSKAEALRLFRDALETYVDGAKLFDDKEDPEYASPGEGIEYIQVYINPDKVKMADIDDVEDVPEEEAECTV